MNNRSLLLIHLPPALCLVASLLCADVAYADPQSWPPNYFFADNNVKVFLSTHSEWKTKAVSAYNDWRKAQRAVTQLYTDSSALLNRLNTAYQQNDVAAIAELQAEVADKQREITDGENEYNQLQLDLQNVIADVIDAMKNL